MTTDEKFEQMQEAFAKNPVFAPLWDILLLYANTIELVKAADELAERLREKATEEEENEKEGIPMMSVAKDLHLFYAQKAENYAAHARKACSSLAAKKLMQNIKTFNQAAIEDMADFILHNKKARDLWNQKMIDMGIEPLDLDNNEDEE